MVRKDVGIFEYAETLYRKYIPINDLDVIFMLSMSWNLKYIKWVHENDWKKKKKHFRVTANTYTKVV